MSQLSQIVRYLDRDDITEVVIQTGRPLTARLSGEYRPLSKNPVSTAQIEALLVGSPLAALLPREDGNEQQNVQLADRTYRVRLARRGPALQVRLEAGWAKPNTEARGESQVGPLPPEDSKIGPLPSEHPSGATERVSSLPDRPSALPPPARPSGLPLSTPAQASSPLIERNAPPAAGTTSPDPPRLRRDAHGAVTRPVDPDELPPGVRLGAAPAPSRGSTGSPPLGSLGSPSLGSLGSPSLGSLGSPSLGSLGSPSLGSAGGPPRSATGSPGGPASPALGRASAPDPGGSTAAPRRTGAPGGQLLALVQQARQRKASDLHLSAGQPALMRTGGELLRVGDVLDAPTIERILLPLLNPAQRGQLTERGYADFALDLESAGRLRVNVSTQRTGLKGSFRLVMHPTPTLEELGLPREIARVTTYHQGLVVIAGPNGHGKTTTLAAIVNIINATRPHHILTVEDPVEFLHERKQAVMSQREVGTHTRSFAAALKASLREDPDVIVIGELRDRETVEIALTAAETGHLVMVTMSTPSAAKTIDRIIDFFPPDDQPQVRASLAGALKFIVAQRLVPAASGEGFVAAVELLTGVPPLWALIRDNKLFQLPSLQQRGRAYGMIRFDDSLVELVRSGKITADVALAAAENKKEMAPLIRVAPPAPLPAHTPGAAQQAADAASTAARGIQDIKSKVGGFFGGSKKE